MKSVTHSKGFWLSATGENHGNDSRPGDQWVEPGELCGTQLIAMERQRQITAEGWHADHDRKHMAGELAMAAVCYALPSMIREVPPAGMSLSYFSRFWPWEHEWWKPTPQDRIRELTKAGALLAAEIDRLQRAERESHHR